MSLLRGLFQGGSEARGVQDWQSWFSFNGSSYPFGLNQTMPGENMEEIEHSFVGYVQGIYKTHGVVAACMLARRHVFSQLRFQWQQMESGRPGSLFGNRDLAILERPWPGGTTSDLLSRSLNLADLGGNAYVTINRSGQVKLPRPDWMTMIIGLEDEPDSAEDVTSDLNATLVGYLYKPPNKKGQILLPEQVAHFAPEPDPLAQYRGMSWLTPVLRNVQAHQAATLHKEKFYTNGATPNMVLSWDKAVQPDKIKAFKDLFDNEFQGLNNAYKTMFLGGGADVTVVGQDFKQLDFKTVQGADETVIAANAGVPPIIAGLSEGLQSSTYSNYGMAKKQFGDTTIQHLGANVAASLEVLLPRPKESPDARLWFDTRDVPFFRDDALSEADVKNRDAQTYRGLLDAGATAESAKAYILSGDAGVLEHSGLFSVQLQKPRSSDSSADRASDDVRTVNENDSMMEPLED